MFNHADAVASINRRALRAIISEKKWPVHVLNILTNPYFKGLLEIILKENRAGRLESSVLMHYGMYVINIAPGRFTVGHA